ncbi:MAG TPA: penicillin-binding transpeptidase domain-containing protein, partial [Longimicrobiales bacterium]|nr:penicillin-binding transpeptidase domain-containing protein [Longimicrobiales bacterium]
LALRQAGSAFKPFVYGAALEEGFALSQPVLDEPYVVAREAAKDWEPGNYSGEFRGPMSLREALVRSQNVPVVRLGAALKGPGVGDFAARAGIPGVVPASPVAALGVTAVSPLEMTAAYAAFAAGGDRPAPRVVLRVEDGDGRVLLETRPHRQEVTDPAVAFLLTDVLRDVVDRGTGVGVRAVGYAGPAAGKTGTTDGATDVWFVGFTPRLVGTVWVGSDGVRPLPPRATGGTVAAPVWGRIFRAAAPGGVLPGPGGGAVAAWPAPPGGVVELAIDRETGMALAEGCGDLAPGADREYFLEGHEPEPVCPPRGVRGFLDRVGGFLGSLFGGDGEERPDIPGEPDPELGLPRIPERGSAAPEPGPVSSPPG